MSAAPAGEVVAVARSRRHGIGKERALTIRLLEGLGVDGDCHAGVTVKHRSRVRADPTQPNLRQVHLMHEEVFGELAARGFTVAATEMGENVTTRGVDLLGLPVGARLRLGADAVVEITGLRNPCKQLEALAPGLMKALLDRAPDGGLIRKAGVMGIVIAGGDVSPGDPIALRLPPPPHRPLDRV